jgi:predicted outer membrane repeat protein
VSHLGSWRFWFLSHTFCRFVHSSPSADTTPQTLAVSVTGCAFSNSKVLYDSMFFFDTTFSPTGYSGGGALFVRLFAATIASSSFADNTALSRPFFTKSDSFDFNAVFSNGGAVLLRANASLTGGELLTVNITSCNFTKNSASGTGSAIFVEDGCVLSLSQSLLSNNFALGGTLTSSGALYVSRSSFINNTAHYLASDVFISCVTINCAATFSSSTFVTLEAAAFEEVKKRGALITGSEAITSNVCDLSIMLVRANGFAPQLTSSSDTTFIDNRNDKQVCGKNDLLIALVDNDMKTEFSVDFTCSTGQYPDRYRSIIASLSRVSLQQYKTALFQYPSFQSATALYSFFSFTYVCRACPPNTCQGIQPLSYFANRDPITLSSDHRAFCKPCPSGARCSDTASLNVTPGLYLWSTNNESNYNISSYAERLPPGFGHFDSTK